jgi:hypothetical protein
MNCATRSRGTRSVSCEVAGAPSGHAWGASHRCGRGRWVGCRVGALPFSEAASYTFIATGQKNGCACAHELCTFFWLVGVADASDVSCVRLWWCLTHNQPWDDNTAWPTLTHNPQHQAA